MKSRCSFVEPLESRRLLAGDVCLASDPIERISGDVFPVSGNVVQVFPYTPPAGIGFAPSFPPQFLPAPLFPGAGIDAPLMLPAGGADLLVEAGGLVAAVRTNFFAGAAAELPPATLHLFDRQDDGSLEESASIELPLAPREVLLTDQLVIVVGSSPRGIPTGTRGAETVVWTVARNDLTDRNTIRLDGLFAAVARRDDRLFVSTFQPSQFTPQFDSPPSFTHTVTVFDTSGGSLSRIASGELPNAVLDEMVVGDDILVVEQTGSSETDVERASSRDATWIAPTELAHHLVRYRIVGDDIERIASLELSADFNLRTEISADGRTAVVFGQHNVVFPAVVDGPQAGYSVALIDLSEDQPKLFQSVDLATRNRQTLADIGERALVIADGRNALIVVDIDQSIDVDAENRVTRIELPGIPDQTYPGITSVTELSPETFAIVRRSYATSIDPVERLSRREVELLTLSLDDHSVVAQSVPDHSALAIFTPSSPRPTLIGLGLFLTPLEARQLVVGRIDGSGQFDQQATIELDDVVEIDADENRLLLRQIDQLIEYRWDSLDDPIVTPLGDPLPAPTAVDDVFRRNSEARDRYLNVLENDQILGYLGNARIVELIDAPAGVVIATGGNVLRLTEEALGSEGTFEFRYVLQQGSQRASAKVTLTLFRYDDDDVRQAVDRVIARAGEDLGVDASDLQIGAVRRFTDRPMPSDPAAGIENPLGGQFGILVDLRVGDQLYRYAANFQDDVVRLSNQPLRRVMELSMRAMDADGNTVASIQSGDEFFIEVIAQDLREFGLGVFAVAFDLPLPVNQLDLTGELMLLGKFDEIGESITARGIDEFSALEALIEHPGSAPQAVVRIGVRAIAGGRVTLQLDPAESLGAELLLRGRNDEVSPLEVDFGSLTLNIDGIEPTDTDASGAVTPSDALRVINFLGVYGSVLVDDLPTLSSRVEGEDGEQRLRSMRRLDTNADGLISARDALHVINDLARLFNREDGSGSGGSNAEAESVDAAIASDFLSDDDDDDTLSPMR
ncbi:dockerin type I domain-containing protein [Stieleria sp. ICT_E10.1]|uniref:dockerin type I domain-containing protein n=1 Tax=Stieleria sedimenti TaxID=2976331 RepID=UPI00217FDA9C|nr:dockerin type I domain-containing protein [Stieleria sedimenti]MCS7465941.1 dockerin type I domain-containing protein [Stieleria sedimenti]